MDDRARRVGKNEAVFRQVNEQIESLNRTMAAISDHTMRVVCECGELSCVEQLTVLVSDYERIRSEPTLFVVLPGHEIPDVEEVVERTPDYHVVRKHEGGPARLARELDLRS